MITDIDLMQRAIESPLGVIETTSGGTGSGLRKHALDKRMKRLVESGYFRPYVHGGYEVTDKGIDLANARTISDLLAKTAPMRERKRTEI